MSANKISSTHRCYVSLHKNLQSSFEGSWPACCLLVPSIHIKRKMKLGITETSRNGLKRNCGYLSCERILSNSKKVNLYVLIQELSLLEWCLDGKTRFEARVWRLASCRCYTTRKQWRFIFSYFHNKNDKRNELFVNSTIDNLTFLLSKSQLIKAGKFSCNNYI